MLLFSQQTSCVISVKNVVSSTSLFFGVMVGVGVESRLLGMINDRKM